MEMQVFVQGLPVVRGAVQKSETIHRFEDAGLGKAPFRCVGVWEMPSKAVQAANPAGYNNALADAPRTTAGGPGSCHYCGTGIIWHHLINSADGKSFLVGSECVRKTGDSGLVNTMKRETLRHKQEKKRLEREARIEAMHETQRQANGGLTDYEARQAKEKMEREERRWKYSEENAWLLDAIRGVPGGFVADMVWELAFRSIGDLSKRQASALMDIYAKTFGRRGGKDYEKAYDQAKAKIYGAELQGEVE